MTHGEHHVFDIHTHYMPLGLPDFADDHGDSRWPVLVEGEGDLGQVRRGTELFRVVERSCFDVEARLEQMDRFGIDTQAISPIPVTLTYWAEPRLAIDYARRQNDELARAVSASNGRLVALAGVPLQDVELAIAEMQRAVSELGMAGVEIGASAGEEELDSPRLTEFFSAAADLGARLFVHPLEGGASFSRCDSPVAAFGVGMLTDTALAGTALVFGGVLERFPTLRVVLAHGGGSFCWCYPRLRFRHAVEPSRGTGGTCVDALVKMLYVDSCVFDEHHLGLLRHHFGADHVLLGSDFPFKAWEAPGPTDVFARAVAAGVLSEAESWMMRGQNALDFMALDPVRASDTVGQGR